jgi:hypothetical protein
MLAPPVLADALAAVLPAAIELEDNAAGERVVVKLEPGGRKPAVNDEGREFLSLSVEVPEALEDAAGEESVG